MTGLRIIWNFASILTGNLLNKAVSIAVLACLTGYFSPAEFGRYSFVMAYISFFGIFTDMGINTVVSREISGGNLKGGDGFGSAIILRLALTAVTAAVSLLALYALGYPSEVLLLAAAAAPALLLSFRGLFFRNVFEIPFLVNLRMSVPATVNFLSELLVFAAIAAMAWRGASLERTVLSINIANIPGFAVMFYLSARLMTPSFRAGVKGLSKLLRASAPLGWASLLEGVFILIPVFLLSQLSTEEAIGIFSLPFRLTASLWIIPTALMTTLLPRMSRDASRSPGDAAHGFFRGLKAMLLVGLPLSVLTCAYSDTVIDVFTGGRYPGSAEILSIMIWGTFFYFLNAVFFYTFTAAGRQGLNAWVWAFNSALLAAGCLLLVPGMSHRGAAMAYAGALGAGFILNTALAYRALGVNAVPVVLKFAACGAAASLVFYLPLPAGFSSGLSSAFYVAALFTFKAVTVREWQDWLKKGPGLRA